MKDKIQIALLSVIAIALVALAVKQFSGASDATSGITASNPSGSSSIVANPATPGETFDPTAGATEKVDNTPKTTATFGNYEHDFGNIKQDSENAYTFSFTNSGTEPLIIENAVGSCGCTVPEYPKEPIPPGGTGDIKVVYKPGKQENAQTKTVTVTANTEPKETVLRIKANVAPGAGGEGPVKVAG
ncbi:MAG: DUF1573 domain-containing protein [Flavobacteriales bacterium]|nr:DUF1573 domain-containing protein [Flavobacteriales bacterium]MBK6946015.1 DUF1573 domain-containing protein [Flavobacteriales bacterium]MBK7239047.1 DUF1573 domain-containing protein [Flavobacteriales bacterium]MBK7296771.1 DUF1573 domain-containing protein [Flavobacteriales bacterium]MBP9138128.1 DUF1573 domain-containing protein [Flavobacteriales bacterium]